jgi:hypothetical protein
VVQMVALAVKTVLVRYDVINQKNQRSEYFVV